MKKACPLNMKPVLFHTPRVCRILEHIAYLFVGCFMICSTSRLCI